MLPPLLRAERLRKVYRTSAVETTAVSDVSLDIYSRDFAILCGPSGCGKSTLLSLLALIATPTSGHIYYGGELVDQGGEVARARLRSEAIGMVFQSYGLVPELTALENVALGLSFNRKVSKKERAGHAAEVLDTVGLGSRMNHYPGQMSGGQQQRVAIARALVGDKRLVFADEPTGNLDSVNADGVIRLFDKIHEKGVAICMVTHDARYLSHGSRMIAMRDGRLDFKE